MNHPVYKTYVSFIMLMVMLTISVIGFSQDSCASETATAMKCAQQASKIVPPEKKTPYCPLDEHSIPDHEGFDCNCLCHASLTTDPFLVICALQIIPLEFHDPFKALPEVYLPKFIPPHILV